MAVRTPNPGAAVAAWQDGNSFQKIARKVEPDLLTAGAPYPHIGVRSAVERGAAILRDAPQVDGFGYSMIVAQHPVFATRYGAARPPSTDGYFGYLAPDLNMGGLPLFEVYATGDVITIRCGDAPGEQVPGAPTIQLLFDDGPVGQPFALPFVTDAYTATHAGIGAWLAARVDQNVSMNIILSPIETDPDWDLVAGGAANTATSISGSVLGYTGATVPNTGLAFQGVNAQDVDVQARFLRDEPSIGSTSFQLVARMTDGLNFTGVRSRAGNFELVEVVAGVENVLATIAHTVFPIPVRLVMIGPSIYLYIGGVLVYDDATAVITGNVGMIAGPWDGFQAGMTDNFQGEAVDNLNLFLNSAWLGMSGSVGGADWVPPTNWGTGFWPPDDAVAGPGLAANRSVRLTANANRGYLTYDIPTWGALGFQVGDFVTVSYEVIKYDGNSRLATWTGGGFNVIRQFPNNNTGRAYGVIQITDIGQAASLRLGLGTTTTTTGDSEITQPMMYKGDGRQGLLPYQET